MLRALPHTLLLCLLLTLAPSSALSQDEGGGGNAAQARKVLDAVITALGGDRWLQLDCQLRTGHIAAFYHGKPSGGTTRFWEYHSWPDHDRSEYTVHRDVIQIYIGRKGWEVTYKGKTPLPTEQVDDYLRRRDHSVETALKEWLKDPRTILIYEGQHLASRHLADQVTLISAQNESVTILADVQNHLPLQRTFSWRDPVYKDKNADTEEYDDYHTVDGLPTPFTVTRFRNSEMTRQSFLDKVTYHPELPLDFWDVDAIMHHTKK